MNPDMTPSECARFPMGDYDALEREVTSIRERLMILEPRYTAMTERLDRITSPVTRTPAESVILRHRGFEWRGQFFAERSCIGIHHALMRRLWTEFPEQRDVMLAAVGSNSRSRSYVARTPEALFRNQSAAWSRRHSRTLVEGWFIDTNMNPEQMQTILRLGAAAVGLTWGKDVKVVWRGG